MVRHSEVIQYHRFGMNGLTGGYEMNLLKTKSWSAFDLVWFKIACVTFGLLVGAFLSNYVIQSAWLIGVIFILTRSEERRVGKECRSRWSPYH